jgi:hypothetical protein
MATVNCPFIGTWKKGNDTIVFFADGTYTINSTPSGCFLVWENGSARTLLTAQVVSSALQTSTYSFTVNPIGTITLTLVSGSGTLAGTLAPDSGNTPTPLSLSNIFIGPWNVQATTSGMENGPWCFNYSPEGYLITTHKTMGHTFTNTYMVCGNYLITLGMMRFNPFKIGVIRSTSPIQVVEDAGGSNQVIWDYTAC